MLSIESGEIQAMNHDTGRHRQRGQPAPRRGRDSFVQGIFRAGKPVGVICHGPWTLVEADLVRGRTLTSYPSIRTDIRNAGGNVVDEEVVTDQGLVSSRNPDDLPAFCAKIVEEFAAGEHEVHDEGATASGRVA